VDFRIRMSSQVQVLACPPSIPPAHGHPRPIIELPLPAGLTGSCHRRATPSGGPVLGGCRRRLDQLVQGGRDGSVPPSHDVLIAQGSGRRGMPHPHHQLPSAGARRNRQSRRSMAEVMEAQPLHAGGSGSWDPHPAGEVATPDRPTPLGREHQPLRAGLGIGAQVLGQRLGRHRWHRHRAAGRRRSWSARKPTALGPPRAARPR
jgi:hypothetical protein